MRAVRVLDQVIKLTPIFISKFERGKFAVDHDKPRIYKVMSAAYQRSEAAYIRKYIRGKKGNQATSF